MSSKCIYRCSVYNDVPLIMQLYIILPTLGPRLEKKVD